MVRRVVMEDFYLRATEVAIKAFGEGTHVVVVDGQTLQARAADGSVLVSVTRNGFHERRAEFMRQLRQLADRAG